MITITECQMAALSYYVPFRKTGKAPAVSTERALLRNKLITERQATDAEKLSLGREIDQPWSVTELTAQGQLLLGQIAEAKTEAPRRDADPFAVFDQFLD